jgi:hypothetical protein
MSGATLRAAAFLGCLWLTFTAASAAEIHIPLYHASYEVSRNGFQIGNAEFSLTRNGDGSYNYKSVTQPIGLAALFFSDVITESSRFTVRDGKPESLQYDYKHSSNDDDKTEHILFDWENHRAESSSGKRQKRLSIKPGTFDRALAQLAVSLDMATGKLADSYCVLDHGELSNYRMERDADGKLRTPSGNYQVIEVARKDIKKKRTTTFWLAPKIDYLPVKIEQTEPGKATISLTLTDIHLDQNKTDKP